MIEDHTSDIYEEIAIIELAIKLEQDTDKRDILIKELADLEAIRETL